MIDGCAVQRAAKLNLAQYALGQDPPAHLVEAATVLDAAVNATDHDRYMRERLVRKAKQAEAEARGKR